MNEQNLRSSSPDLDLAWAAGFFEGEGTVFVDDREALAQPRLRLCLSQRNHREIVELFKKRVGDVGAISGPGKKNVDQWSVQGAAAHEVMEKLKPYLTVGGAKLERYEEALRQGCRPEKLNAWATGARG